MAESTADKKNSSDFQFRETESTLQNDECCCYLINPSVDFSSNVFLNPFSQHKDGSNAEHIVMFVM